jgi:hypothetical protein
MFEHANIGSNYKHDNHYTTENDCSDLTSDTASQGTPRFTKNLERITRVAYLSSMSVLMPLHILCISC